MCPAVQTRALGMVYQTNACARHVQLCTQVLKHSEQMQ